jgi:drug/metabolite transporter (DMT)-like permease
MQQPDAPAVTVRSRAISMLVLATLYWGISFPIIKTLTSMNRAFFPVAGSWFVTAAATAPRFLLAAILVFMFGRRGGRSAPLAREIKQGLGLGIFASAGTLFQTDGMQFTAASTSAFLTQFSAILIPTWVALRGRRNPGAMVWVCCTLVLVGVGILGHFDWRTLRFGRGEWETLLCSFFFMGQILWIERKEFAGNRPGIVTLTMFSAQALIFCSLAVATAPAVRDLGIPWTSPVWLGLTVALTVICTVGAFSLMNKWQPRITATEAGLIYCIEPVFASIFALFLPALFSGWAQINYPDEHWTWSLMVGGALITIANVLIQTRAKPSPPESA